MLRQIVDRLRKHQRLVKLIPFADSLQQSRRISSTKFLGAARSHHTSCHHLLHNAYEILSHPSCWGYPQGTIPVITDWGQRDSYDLWQVYLWISMIFNAYLWHHHRPLACPTWGSGSAARVLRRLDTRYTQVIDLPNLFCLKEQWRIKGIYT